MLFCSKHLFHATLTFVYVTHHGAATTHKDQRLDGFLSFLSLEEQHELTAIIPEIFEDQHREPVFEIIEDQHRETGSKIIGDQLFEPGSEIIEDQHHEPGSEIIEDQHHEPGFVIIEDQHREPLFGGNGTEAAIPSKKPQVFGENGTVAAIPSKKPQVDGSLTNFPSEEPPDLASAIPKITEDDLLMKNPHEATWKPLLSNLKNVKALLEASYIPKIKAHLKHLMGKDQRLKKTLADLRTEQKKLIVNASNVRKYASKVREHDQQLRQEVLDTATNFTECSGIGAQLIIQNQKMKKRISKMTAMKANLTAMMAHPAMKAHPEEEASAQAVNSNPQHLTDSSTLDPNQNAGNSIWAW